MGHAYRLSLLTVIFESALNYYLQVLQRGEAVGKKIGNPVTIGSDGTVGAFVEIFLIPALTKLLLSS